MKAMIAVTHLLGTGHLSRAIALGHGMRAEGFDVQIVSGGMAVGHLDSEGLSLVQLPPLKVLGGDFATLLTPEGRHRDEGITKARIAAQAQAFTDFAPHILITELFPLGRRSLRAEYLSLLQTAQAAPNRPKVLASVRDILAAPSKPARAAQSIEILRNFYDGVLVHASPAFVSLEQSWPVTPEMQKMLLYTGYVAADLPHATPDGDGADEILVTAGGGAVGDALFEAALEAAANFGGRKWRFLVGGDTRDARIAKLRLRAVGLPVVIEPTRPDFREMLQRAALVVAQCGYNTALDVLAAAKPAVFVPYEEGGETEQLTRAEALLRIGPYTIVREQDLTADNLRLATAQAMSSQKTPDLSLLSLDGARETGRIARKLVEAR